MSEQLMVSSTALPSPATPTDTSMLTAEQFRHLADVPAEVE